jgi:peptidoglycan/xylan/chitin deacetylase (PgdA/CDA1 family)
MNVSDDEFQRNRHPGQGGADPAAQTQYLEQPDRVPAQRRKVLFALGGLTLLAGGGVAAGIAAMTRSSGGKTVTAGAVPTQSASSSPSAAVSASASPSTSPSTTPSSTVPPVTRPQYYVDNNGPRAIALTMDDGPHPVYTPQVLEIFRHYNIKATFNMIGSQVGANLSLVREVSAAGHTITNHTWDHADLTHYTYAQVCSEMDRCNDALANANQHPTIFRAPYGNWAAPVFQACAARNLRAVDWSVDPRDWDTAHVDTQQIVDNVMRHTRPHDIILEHDGGGVRRNTVAALKIFIPRLLDEGYNFVAM